MAFLISSASFSFLLISFNILIVSCVEIELWISSAVMGFSALVRFPFAISILCLQSFEWIPASHVHL